MTTVNHVLDLLAESLKLTVNAGGPHDKAKRLEIAEAGMRTAVDLLREIAAARRPREPDEDPPTDPEIDAFDRGLELGRAEHHGHGELLDPTVAGDEIDEDPPTIDAERTDAYTEGHKDGYGEGRMSAVESYNDEQGPERA